MDVLFPRLVAARGFEDADDIAKVMHYRLARATGRPAGSGCTRKPPVLIAGLIPQAAGAMSPEMRQALTERRDLIEQRADAVLDTALTEHHPWTGTLSDPPADAAGRARWRQSARTIAAYRDRYGISDDAPLGPQPKSAAQKIDHARAASALRRLTPQAAPEHDGRRDPVSIDRGGPSL